MHTPASRRRAAPETEPAAGPLAAFVAAHRPGLGAFFVLAAAAAAGWVAWLYYGAETRWHPDVVLLPDAVRLEGVADWVTADVKTEALVNASLHEGLPLHDPELQRRLARAFDMHPWVRRVIGVELRHPAAAVVRVECREPVATVAWQDGLLAIDAEGVVLPSDDFSAAQAARYPRVEGIGSSPQGAEGFPWGDPAVEEAAAVAAAVGPEAGRLELVVIRPLPGAAPRRWELVAAAGGRILFGAAPGREAAAEPPAAAKLSRLKHLAIPAAEGRLDLTVESTDPEPRAIPGG